MKVECSQVDQLCTLYERLATGWLQTGVRHPMQMLWPLLVGIIQLQMILGSHQAYLCLG